MGTTFKSLAKKRQRVAYSIELKNVDSGHLLKALVAMPQEKQVSLKAMRAMLTKEAPDRARYWECRYVVRLDGKVVRSSAAGDSWLQAILQAVEGVRQFISDDPSDRWTTEDGVPAWVIFPKLVPIAWGLEEFDRIASSIDAREEKLNAKLRKRFGS